MNKILTTLTFVAFASSISFNTFAADTTKTSEKKITFQELPSKVQKAAKDVCPEADMSRIEKETYKGKPAYEIGCTQGGKTEYYYFSDTGTMIKKESAKEEEKEESGK
jgi:hypothetical protein